MFNFEKLEVWQKAIVFADSVYSVTRAFPENERFGLTSQMRRAAVSVSSNIAEGSAHFSNKEFARFIEIATGSLFEVISQSQISLRQGFLISNDHHALWQQAQEMGRMLSGLRRRLLESEQPPFVS